jgi:putative chitinase
MSPDKLHQIMPFAGARADTFAEPLTDAMTEFLIVSPRQQAAFLAQVAYESGSLIYTEEIADGTAYNGRLDLGNTSPGDGPKYKGRGFLQVTGKANYRQCGVDLGLDLVDQPSLLALPKNACRSAAWFWKTRGLNDLADKDQFGAITKRINGGFNGLDARIGFWLIARQVMGL